MVWKYTPARDLEATPHERVRSMQRAHGVLTMIGGYLWWTLISIVMQLWHRLEIEGRENFPKEGPVVVISNHSSHLDTASLMAALPLKDRDFFTLAAADYFFTRPLMALFMAITVNALPMARGKGREGHQSLATLRRRLLEERIGLILYPEGTRSRSGNIARFRSGIGTLVAGTDIPVVPCYIDGAHAAWPAGVRWPRPRKIRVIVGKPMTFSKTSAEPDGCREVAAQLEAAVKALGGIDEELPLPLQA